MKAEHINPFILSTINVFSTTLSCPLQRGQIYTKQQAQPEHEVSGIIGLSGKASGMVVLTLNREVALRAARALLGDGIQEINSDVADVIGELTNMIAGGAKGQLEQFEMSVSLPSVIMGKNHVIQFPSNATPICIPFDSPWGPVCLQVSILEVPNGVSGYTSRPPERAMVG